MHVTEFGLGYWIYMTRSDTLYVTGYVIPPASTPPTYTLTAGWNMLGFKPQPIVQNETVGQYLVSINGKYDMSNVWIYDNFAGKWIRASSSDWLLPGQAMWIFVTATGSITLKP